MGQRPNRRAAAAVMVLVSMAAASACSTPAPPPAAVVRSTLRDFRIAASPAVIPAGLVEFRITNRGPGTHEFVVVRTDDPPAALPLQADGLSMDEEARGVHVVGEDDRVALGEDATLTLSLAPGRYVLLCNLDGHYLGGMHRAIEVAG